MATEETALQFYSPTVAPELGGGGAELANQRRVLTLGGEIVNVIIITQDDKLAQLEGMHYTSHDVSFGLIYGLFPIIRAPQKDV